MYLALGVGHREIAKLVARKGAVCTPDEKRELGKKFSDFEQEMERERREQGGVGGQMGSGQIEADTLRKEKMEAIKKINELEQTTEALRLQLEEKSKQHEQMANKTIGVSLIFSILGPLASH